MNDGRSVQLNDWDWRLAITSIFLLIAGCQGFGSQTPTLTPAPVHSNGSSSPATTPSPNLPPGVSTTGVDNASVLVNAHMDGLENQSYTIQDRTLYVLEDNQTAFRSNTTVRVGANRRQYYYVTRVTGQTELALEPAQHREIWSDGNRVFAAENGSCSGNENPRVLSRASNAPLPVDLTYEEQLSFIFSTVETNNTEKITEGSTTLYRIDTIGVQENNLATVENFSLRAWIDEDGVIRRYRMTYLTVVNGRLMRVRETLRFSALGKTKIERPDWYDCLKQNTTDG